MNTFVLDASIVLSWFVDRTAVAYAQHIQQRLLKGDTAIVPAIWHLEIANGLIIAERRGIQQRRDIDEAAGKLSLVISKSITTDEDPISISSVLASGRQFRLTAYDAIYLEVAKKRKLPMATLDRALLAAASQAGVGAFS